MAMARVGLGTVKLRVTLDNLSDAEAAAIQTATFLVKPPGQNVPGARIKQVPATGIDKAARLVTAACEVTTPGVYLMAVRVLFADGTTTTTNEAAPFLATDGLDMPTL